MPPLKTDPKYGYFPRWPEDGDDWVHPRDRSLARSYIPGPRVFRRDGHRGDYVVLHYGRLRLRVKPALWNEVPGEGFEVGDWVEVLSRGQINTPRTGVIREMHWDARTRSMMYFIDDNRQPIPKAYSAADLRHVEPTRRLEEEPLR
jgi:hypothetical protein